MAKREYSDRQGDAMTVLDRSSLMIPPGGGGADAVPLFPKAELQIGISRSAPQPPSELHGHDFMEIAVIETGLAFYTYEGTKSRVEAGDVFVVLPYHAHQYTGTEGLKVSNVLFYDDGSIPLLRELSMLPAYRALFQLEPSLRQTYETRGRLSLDGDRLRALLHLLHQLEEALHRSDHGGSTVATVLFLKLIADLCDAYDKVSPRVGRSLLLVGKVMTYIERHFRDDIPVEDLARLGKLSLRGFQRHFRLAAGMPVVRYIAEKRFEEACRLLKAGQTNIAETAHKSGFRDPNYFSRSFRDRYGMTPRQYQRNHA